MTERLTKWHGDRADCNVGYCSEECDICNMLDEIRTKLAYYEDLEEQGRLIILPKELDPKRLLNIIADLVCPRYVGLEDWGHDKEKCPSAGCNECWEKALKE